METEIQNPKAKFAVMGGKCPDSTGKARQSKTRKGRFFYAAKSLKKFIWGESNWILLWKVRVLSYIYFFLIDKTQTEERFIKQMD